MKKCAAFLLFILLAPVAYAGECEKITNVDDYYVQVTSGVNIRDKVCDGSVIGTLSAGTVVKVTGEIEGWRHIERPGGGVGFVWSDFVKKTTAPETQKEDTPKEPLYDVKNHAYETAIRYLEEEGAIQGYPDGSYQPEKTVNRAEFTKILIGAKLGMEPQKPDRDCFKDVPLNEWYAPYICYAKEKDILDGYPDGTFRPADTINLVEAAKILVNTLGVEVPAVPADPWYRPFIQALQNRNHIPDSFTDFAQLVNRGQMAELTWRIMENVQNRPAKSFAEDFQTLIGEGQVCFNEAVPENVDMKELREAWLSWHNEVRTLEGEDRYSMNEGLNYSAALWSRDNYDRGTITHNRLDNASLSEWFGGLDIQPKTFNGNVYAENLGWGRYHCEGADCTEEMKDAIRETFDAFMAEKGTDYTDHYDNIVEGDFHEIGLGLAVDTHGEEFFLTAHYSSGLLSYPLNICSP